MGDIHARSDALCVSSIEVEHQKRQPELLRQAFDGLLQIILCVQVLPGQARWLSDRQLSTSLFAKTIDAQISGNSHYPGPEPLRIIERCHLQKAFQHCLLRGILGVVDICEHCETYAKDVPVVFLDEHIVPCFVFPATPGDRVLH
jgi:hypothetical protein